MRAPTGRIAGLFAALGLVLILLAVRRDEEKAPHHDLPQAVLDAVKARFPAGKITGTKKEVEDGVTEFAVELEDKGRKIEVTLTAEGEITDIEKEIAAKELPEPVAKALEAKYPKAVYKTIKEIIEVEKKEETATSYEVSLVTADQKKLEVEVDPDGEITKVEDQSKHD
jgi:uncharacterized membrane protein YkoI